MTFCKDALFRSFAFCLVKIVSHIVLNFTFCHLFKLSSQFNITSSEKSYICF